VADAVGGVALTGSVDILVGRTVVIAVEIPAADAVVIVAVTTSMAMTVPVVMAMSVAVRIEHGIARARFDRGNLRVRIR
jgi:hypothetical protein